jgi:hypothetical protein
LDGFQAKGSYIRVKSSREGNDPIVVSFMIRAFLGQNPIDKCPGQQTYENENKSKNAQLE